MFGSLACYKVQIKKWHQNIKSTKNATYGRIKEIYLIKERLSQLPQCSDQHHCHLQEERPHPWEHPYQDQRLGTFWQRLGCKCFRAPSFYPQTHPPQQAGCCPTNESPHQWRPQSFSCQEGKAADLLILDSIPHVVCIVFQGVLCINLLLVLFVFRLVLLGLLNHLLDFFLRQPTLVIGNGDLVLLASDLVLGRNIQNTICVNVEANIDLRNTPGSWRNARKLEFAQQVVVPGSCPLTLKNLDQHTRLVVRVGRENLLFLGGNSSVSGNQDSHNTSSGLQTKGQRSNIQKQ
ncbi:LOW QUALITY PROTEIN: Glutamate dehydrogenase, NAD-specific [Parasponia andersonii]|uniref:Glutamate dehydrogenase, NAD-specific n=1 Tax=Parasponia andersonii TaxID=3476 RepID=A0A2P5C6E9_PARAD|nr:LOW QUALITY PROTEIN: Glutamate dehydrogenase, NAD-specific [Parasponia andersonii]